jgi:excisionase family DNA binding protein
VAQCVLIKEEDQRSIGVFRLVCDILQEEEEGLVKLPAVNDIVTIRPESSREAWESIEKDVRRSLIDSYRRSGSKGGGTSSGRRSRVPQAAVSYVEPSYFEEIPPPVFAAIPDFVPGAREVCESGEEPQIRADYLAETSPKHGLTSSDFVDQTDSLLPTTVAAQRVGLSRRQVSKLAMAGQIKAFKQGRDYLVSLAELQGHINRSRTRGRRNPGQSSSRYEATPSSRAS